MADTDLSGSERRLHSRYPVDLTAELRGHRQSVVNCRVRDLGSGGMRLDLGVTDISLRLQLGEHCQIRVDLSTTWSSSPVQAIIEMVRQTDSELGVRFVYLAGNSQQKLARFITRIIQHVGRENPAELAQNQATALAILEDVTRQRLPVILDSLLRTIIEELWNHCERAENDSVRMRFSSEIGLLVQSIQNAHLLRQMNDALLDALADSSLEIPNSEKLFDTPSRELALVEQDAFETWLVKSEVRKRLELEVSESIGCLRLQTVPLLDRTRLPIEPKGLTDILEQSLRATGIGEVVLRASLQIVGKSLPSDLDAFYRALVTAWSERGLVIHEPPAVEATQPQPTHPAPPQIPAATPGNAPQTPGLDLVELLTTLQSGQPCPDTESRRSVPNALLREPWHEWWTAIETEHRDQLRSPQLHERIAVTDRMLNHILEDTATPPPIKAILNRLPIHFLSMTIGHPGALSNDQHPLIRLMNQMEKIALFLPNGERDDQALQQEFSALIEQLVVTSAQDLQALDTLLSRLRMLESRLAQAYRSNVAYWVQACHSRERQRAARQRVRDQLNMALGGRRVHHLMTELLNAGWRSLLELDCHDEGSEGSLWQQHWELLWCLHLATGGEGVPGSDVPRHATELIPALLAGLAAIGADPFTCAELSEKIEAVLERARLSRLKPHDYAVFAKLLPDPDDEPDAPSAGLTLVDWEWGVIQIDALPVGALVWMRDKAVNRARRLVWRSQDGSRLALADPLGRRIKRTRRSRLVKALCQGTVSLQVPSRQGLMTRAADATIAEMQARLHEHDIRDPLTGLENQHRFRGSLIRLLQSSNDIHPGYVFGFLELDRLDVVTGIYGYVAGEQVLVAVAELLRQQLPNAHCLAYLGGNRFGLLAPAVDHQQAARIGEVLRTALNAIPFAWQGKTFRMSGSFGLTFVTALDVTSEQSLSAASLACLAARRNGGDRVILFSENHELICGQLDQMRDWVQTEEVIKAQRCRLRCQRVTPVNPGSGAAHHCEILLSVYDEQGEPLPLANFIAAAESLNLMQEVDRQVIDATFQWFHDEPLAALAEGGVAINLSGQSLNDPDLAASIRAGLERWEIPADLVGFEVTETAAIADLERAALILNEINDMGCKLYLDDFGSGLSSYEYLKRLPVGYIKIDGSFIKDILNNPHDQAIVRSFNEIAHFMGKQTIAEYVESEAILNLLREMGVDYAQGYAIDKPRFVTGLDRG